jgi:hypothetical protein
MNSELNNRPQTTDEIDLLELFGKMWQGFKNGVNWLINLILKFFLLLIRKSLWIISFGIIGLIVGYVLYINTKRFYSSEMTAISNSVDNAYIVNSINLLNDLFKEKNYPIAANYLDIDTAKAKQIKSIEAFYALDYNKDSIPDLIDYDKTYNPKDTSIKRMEDFFVIRLEVFNERVFTSARDGIINYINRNKFITENNEERLRQNSALIESLKSEIKKLDSLQKVEYFELPMMQKANTNQMVVLNEKDRKLYHNDKLRLEEKLLKIEKDMTINREPITIVQDFTPLSKAENPYSKYAKNFGLLFAILGFILSIIWQYKRKIFDLIVKKHY